MDNETQHNIDHPKHSEYSAEEIKFGESSARFAAAPHNRPVFWKVTAVGLGTGLTAGALLAFTVTQPLLGALGVTHASPVLLVIYAACMAAGGLLGSAIGAGKAKSWQPADNIGLYFDVLNHAHTAAQEPQKSYEKTIVFPINTIVTTGDNDCPMADTHNRDQILTAARQALLSMDHTKVIPN